MFYKRVYAVGLANLVPSFQYYMQKSRSSCFSVCNVEKLGMRLTNLELGRQY